MWTEVCFLVIPPSLMLTACFLHGYTCFDGNACSYPYNAVTSRVTCFHGQVCCEVPPCISYCSNGTCLAEACICHDGFSGIPCDVDACENNADCVNGTCVRLPDGQQNCSCDDGFSGDTCNVDACADNGDCVNGTCVRLPEGQHNCSCDDGFSGDTCNVDACADNGDCVNGTCVRLPEGQNNCSCDDGFSGDTCNVDACADNGDCVNGTCVRLPEGQHNCSCDDGFSGNTCNVDACENNGACVNGMCLRIGSEPYYSCDCDLGYSDYNCSFLNWTCTFKTHKGVRHKRSDYLTWRADRSVDECRELCANDVDCIGADYKKPTNSCRLLQTVNNMTTNTKFFFFEKRCALACDPQCNAQGGLCHEDDTGSRTCECDAGYYGDECENNACEPDPCDEGTCVATTVDPFYGCYCYPGFGGQNCSDQVCHFQEMASTRSDGAGRSNGRSNLSIEECKRHCLDDEACVAAEYKDDGRCWRWKNSLPPTKPKSGFTFMPKTCV